MACFRGCLGSWLKRWFRGCAHVGARCRVARQGKDFEFDGNDAFTLRPGSAGRLARTRQDLCELARLSASFTCGISMHVSDGADMATNLDALLHLTQALESAAPAAKIAPGLGNAERSARRQRSATDGGGASAEHRIDARHFERTFQPCLARHRSSPGTVLGRYGIDLERAISQRHGTRDRLAR